MLAGHATLPAPACLVLLVALVATHPLEADCQYVIPPAIKGPDRAMFELLPALPPCLDNATAMTNISWGGRDQPFMVLDYRWASASFLHRVFTYLVRERLGFDARLQRGLGTSRVSHRIHAGCHANMMAAQELCTLDEVDPPVTHYSLENWGQYNHKNTPSVEQPDAIDMEFPGVEGMFVPAKMLERGAKDGVALNYYKFWDTGFYDPTKYGLNLPQYAAKILEEGWVQPLCTDNSAVLGGQIAEDYVKWTGDVDNLIIVNGTKRLRCDHPEFPNWYMTPKCRVDPTTCTPLITSGGWGAMFLTQQMTNSNASVALTSLSWGSYTDSGILAETPMYWWHPDNLFASANPTEVVFPPHSSDEWKMGNRKSQVKPTVVKKFATKGVAALSKQVYHLYSKFDMSPAAVMEAMQWSLDEPDPAKLACKWLRDPSKQAVWQSWLPDPRDCELGFGLPTADADAKCQRCVGGTVSTVVDGTRFCHVCPAGFYCIAGAVAAAQCDEGSYCPSGSKLPKACPKASFNAKRGRTSLQDCLPCAPGMVAKESGSTSCVPCEEGRYSLGGASASVCEACALSTFSAQGAARCTDCPTGFVTVEPASSSMRDCTCPRGTLYLPAEPNVANETASGVLTGGSCVPCGPMADQPGGERFEGLACPGGFACRAVENTKGSSSFPCLEACVATDSQLCATQCVVPLFEARALCESARYMKVCSGWAVKSAAVLTDKFDVPDSRTGRLWSWSTVAVLVAQNAAGGTLTSALESDVAWTFYPQARHCRHPFDASGNVARAQQPPMAKVGYYLSPYDPLNNASLGDKFAESLTNVSATYSLAGLAQPLAPGAELYVFKCLTPVSCPGGSFGQCFPGETGLACGHCSINYYSAATGCQPCLGSTSVAVALMAVIVLAAEAMFVVLYVVTDNPLSSRVAGTMATAVALSTTINGLQTFSVFRMLAVDWPSPLGEILDALKIFMLDIDALQWECVAPVTPLGKFVVKLGAPAFVAVSYAALFLLTRLVPSTGPLRRLRFNLPHTVNCVGVVVQLLFISICLGLIIPFKCKGNPAGIATLIDFPSVACGGESHTFLSSLGAIFLVLYPGLFFAGSAYLVRVLPQLSAAHPQTLRYCKFLIGRFRPDRYYFGVLFLLRNLLLGIAPIVDPENALVQCLALSFVLLLALFAQLLLWPWAVATVNLMDSFCLFCFILSTVASAGLGRSATAEGSVKQAQAVVAIVTILFVAVFIAMIAVICHVLRITVSEWRTGRPYTTLKRELKIAQVGNDFIRICRSAVTWKPSTVTTFVDELSPFDLTLLGNTVGMVLTMVDMPEDSTSGRSSQSAKKHASMRLTVSKVMARRRSSVEAREIAEQPYTAEIPTPTGTATAPDGDEEELQVV